MQSFLYLGTWTLTASRILKADLRSAGFGIHSIGFPPFDVGKDGFPEGPGPHI